MGYRSLKGTLKGDPILEPLKGDPILEPYSTVKAFQGTLLAKFRGSYKWGYKSLGFPYGFCRFRV